ncbi:ribokinase [Flavimobilis marinus]|uniref:Ribokinase n=1 Tax=Flavimobilis marinus TaxID=285351 RepID=A0A1I2FZW0_9MICO|nr:ribokinase [Flavimobilis marinus]GHG50724.1 ribokinase [Flavimobilis marinus]SFF10358.1 ribokinase [Flavimobilis marinus]
MSGLLSVGDPPEPAVVVVGSANLDLVVPVPRHAGAGETILGGLLARNAGGKGANQAVASARAGGASTTFVGSVGDDDGAVLLASSLADAGVRTDLLRRVDVPTGIAMISVSPDGENAIVVAPGANGEVRVDGEVAERIAACHVLLAQLEVPQEVVLAAARARRPGARFVLNAAPSATLVPGLLEEVDVLVVNEHEARDLVDGADGGTVGTYGAGAQDPGALAAALLTHVPAVVVTLGGEGAIVAARGAQPVLVPAHAVRPVDTTGAGDTFCGVLAAALATGDDLVAAAGRASAAGALAVTRPGAQSAVPTHDEVSALWTSAPRPAEPVP